MTFKLEPQISRPKRQSAVEQTSDLLKAYLEHQPDPFAIADDLDITPDPDGRASTLTAGFILPHRRSA